jgi:hypothetical protein
LNHFKWPRDEPPAGPVFAHGTIREIRVPPIAAGPDDDIYDINPRQ